MSRVHFSILILIIGLTTSITVAKATHIERGLYTAVATIQANPCSGTSARFLLKPIPLESSPIERFYSIVHYSRAVVIESLHLSKTSVIKGFDLAIQTL